MIFVFDVLEHLRGIWLQTENEQGALEVLIGPITRLEPENGAKEQLVAEEIGAKEEAALHIHAGPMTRSKAKLFNQAISSLLIQADSNLSNIAYPTTLVVIQAS